MLSDSAVEVRCDAGAALSSWEAARSGWGGDGTSVSFVSLEVKSGATSRCRSSQILSESLRTDPGPT